MRLRWRRLTEQRALLFEPKVWFSVQSSCCERVCGRRAVAGVKDAGTSMAVAVWRGERIIEVEVETEAIGRKTAPLRVVEGVEDIAEWKTVGLFGN